MGPGSVSLDSQEMDETLQAIDTNRHLATSIETLNSELMEFINKIHKTKRVHKKQDANIDDLYLRLRAAQIRRNDLEDQGEIRYRVNHNANSSPAANAKASTANFSNKFR